MEFERRKKIEPKLEITPLVDVVFLLILFFMLTANFIMQPGIKIKLPEAKTSKPQEQENIFVYVTPKGEIFLNNRNLKLQNLFNELKKEIRLNKEKIVIIKADEKVNLGLVVKIFDISKLAGAKGITISTQEQKIEGEK